MLIEMLSGFTANISMETQIQQNRRYTTIQLDIIHTGDCLKILKTLPDDSVHCCVTSPPYYALRDYGMEAQIGRETTPKEYISRLTEVFTEVRRVLRPDGTLWLNISDTYAGKGKSGLQESAGDFIDPKNPNGRNGQAVALNNKVEGCKPKDMIGIPWMLAFALRDTGWYLRNDIIWMKDNPMPESVKDRCARCYEHIFLFSKSKKYFFDYKAISEPIAPATAERLKRGMKGGNKYGKPVPGQPQPQSINRPREHGEIITLSVRVKSYLITNIVFPSVCASTTCLKLSFFLSTILPIPLGLVALYGIPVTSSLMSCCSLLRFSSIIC